MEETTGIGRVVLIVPAEHVTSTMMGELRWSRVLDNGFNSDGGVMHFGQTVILVPASGKTFEDIRAAVTMRSKIGRPVLLLDESKVWPALLVELRGCGVLDRGFNDEGGVLTVGHRMMILVPAEGKTVEDLQAKIAEGYRLAGVDS